jgi:drug/metabolite transporter (DMT)-like permease
MFERMKIDLLLTMAFSLFGMLLIFGLGFVFPSVNPYVVIKWIVIVCAAVFLYSLLSYFIWSYGMMKGDKKGGRK